MARIPKYLIVDDFLPADLHRELLEYTLARPDGFVHAKIIGDEGRRYNPEMRESFTLRDGLGPLEDRFVEAIRQVRKQACDELGIPRFPVCLVEFEIAAHRQGGYFRPHIDTLTEQRRDQADSDRILTLVYYFHVQPRRFSGGELAMLPLGPGEPVLIEPRDNRLLAFPSFALHEVRPVECEDDDFASSRFAINCWLHRPRASAPDDQ